MQCKVALVFEAVESRNSRVPWRNAVVWSATGYCAYRYNDAVALTERDHESYVYCSGALSTVKDRTSCADAIEVHAPTVTHSQRAYCSVQRILQCTTLTLALP
jgi:hypothetical protein